MVNVEKFCSSQVRIDQQPHYHDWRRTHGLQIPLHWLQVIGWLLLAFFMGTTFAILVPALGPRLHSPALFVLGCLFFLHCVSHFAALAIDPADYELRVRERAGIKKQPDFDRSRHMHVIENGLCHICNIRASGPRTKHCRLCNKCVERFDHHCKWLNQCIGARNYVAFVVCVVSAVLASLAVLSVCISELVIYFGNSLFVETMLQEKGLSNADLRAAQLPIPKHYFLAVVIMQTILALVAAMCLLHLCLFHIYISVLGLTTYEYIRNDKPCSGPTNTNFPSPATGSGLQSTSSLLATFNPYPPSDRDNSINCSRSRETSETNLSSKQQSNSGNFLPVWRRWCCHQKSITVESISHVVQPKIDSGISANCSETSLENLRYGHQKSLSRTGQSECKYCKKTKTFSRGSTNNCNISQRAKNKRGLFQFCCHRVHTKSTARSLRGSSTSFNGCRRNQIKPSALSTRFCDRNCNSAKNRIFIAPRRSNSLNSLPALPPPTRHQIQSVSLKELNEILAYAQRPQTANGTFHRPLNSVRRQLRRKSNPQLKPTKTPNLSPIHESGLSNPSTPHLRDRLDRRKELSPLALNSRF